MYGPDPREGRRVVELLGERPRCPTPLSARSELPRGPASNLQAWRGGEVVLRSNVSADVLRSFGEDLKNVAEELEAPPEPGDTTH
jgi:hypothetical protein